MLQLRLVPPGAVGDCICVRSSRTDGGRLWRFAVDGRAAQHVLEHLQKMV
jgi:hypothetical protein